MKLQIKKSKEDNKHAIVPCYWRPQIQLVTLEVQIILDVLDSNANTQSKTSKITTEVSNSSWTFRQRKEQSISTATKMVDTYHIW